MKSTLPVTIPGAIEPPLRREPRSGACSVRGARA